MKNTAILEIYIAISSEEFFLHGPPQLQQKHYKLRQNSIPKDVPIHRHHNAGYPGNSLPGTPLIWKA